MPEYARYQAAVAALDARIDPVGPADQSLAAVWRRAAQKRDRAGAFLRYLGDPHRRFAVVHVTGTSGKGSTSAMIATGLTAAGYRTGLATSPYLQVATEKLQIGGQLIGGDDFAAVVRDVLAAGATWQATTGDTTPLTYGELWLAMQATWLSAQQVDAAVIEVGAGGRFDVTNVVAPSLAVITSVGLDHTQTLGPRLADIAWHKAGIIKRGVPVVSGVGEEPGAAIIAAEAAALAAPLTLVDPAAYDVVARDDNWLTWRPAAAPSLQFRSRPPATFQASNGLVARAALETLAAGGWRIPPAAIAAGLAEGRMPGRSEWMPAADGPRVLIDAAHNPDKMKAFGRNLMAQLPAGSPPPVLVTGLLDGKDVAGTLGHVLPSIGGVVTTAAGVRGKDARQPASVASAIRATGYAGPVASADDVAAAMTLARQIAVQRQCAIVVTGSMYLIGQVRMEWYPGAAIVRQRTPWPAPDAG